jgi:hypothetical protein
MAITHTRTPPGFTMPNSESCSCFVQKKAVYTSLSFIRNYLHASSPASGVYVQGGAVFLGQSSYTSAVSLFTDTNFTGQKGGKS